MQPAPEPLVGGIYQAARGRHRSPVELYQLHGNSVTLRGVRDHGQGSHERASLHSMSRAQFDARFTLVKPPRRRKGTRDVRPA